VAEFGGQTGERDAEYTTLQLHITGDMERAEDDKRDRKDSAYGHIRAFAPESICSGTIPELDDTVRYGSNRDSFNTHSPIVPDRHLRRNIRKIRRFVELPGCHR
jgi:hypothetical protein